MPHVVHSLCPPRGVAGRLHCRQQQTNQRGDDRNHHQQFNEREPMTSRGIAMGG